MILGWRFRRIIIFVSWDVEEFGLLGLIEWVEVSSMEGIYYNIV